MKRFLILLTILMLGLAVNAEEKIIRVPSEMTVEMILANDQGLLNGNFDIRARIYDPTSKKRVWFENLRIIQLKMAVWCVDEFNSIAQCL